MAGLIQEDAIRSIRERASVVEVVSDVVALRRRGRSFTGLCPFHTEKTPSFTVSEERGFFHCFGCGEHGDVFAFVMKTQSLPFPDAVRRVAQRFGLPVPEDGGGAARRRSEPLVAVNDAAATFFRNVLRGAAGAGAREYLQERGLGADVVERFGLGYAPGSGEGLWRQLRAEGFPVEDTLTVGLVLRRGNSGLLDRFRDRVMFPITDPMGRVIAFGGRILPGRPTAGGDPPPKYLNSPDSSLFHKGQTVYGLAQAREGIRKSGRVIVVEGYMDVIALAGAGISEVTAPLGTALTADQLRVLRRFTESVIACFDGDAAGRRAAARSFPIFLEAGLWARGIFLPEDTDPDSFVRAQGPAALEVKLASPEPLIEAWLEGLAGTSADAVGRHAAAADEVVRLLKRVRNPHEYNALARLAGQRLGVGEQLLRSEAAPEVSKPVSRSAPVAVGAPGVEELLVELMAVDATIASRVRAENLVAEFEDPQWRMVAETLLATAADVDRTAAVEALPREIRDRVVRRLLGEVEEGSREQEVADCIARIHARRRGRTQTRLRDAIRAAEARGDTAAVNAALTELKHLTEKART